MPLIDTHAHLYLEQFDTDRGEVIQRAKERGLEQVLLPNIDRSTTEALWKTVELDPVFFRPMMGLHPCSVNKTFQEELDHVHTELKTGKYSAVGEIGMDLYWDKTFMEQQAEAFETQMEWAKEFDLPVAIHCRDAFDEVFGSVEKVQDGRLRGVLHCFTGDAGQAERCVELGLHIGLGGVLTFKNGGVDKAIAAIGMEHFVLETDAPYLAPKPYRGKRNEAAYVGFVAERLAEVKNISLEEVEAVTTINAKRLFGL